MSTLSFGDVRAAAHARPCPDAWNTLCALLERAKPWRARPHLWRGRLLPYLLGALGRWPAALRVVPDAWMRVDPDAPPCPGIAIATTIDVSPELASWWRTRDGELSRWELLQARELAAIRHLRVRACNVDELFVHQLVHAPHVRQLRSLDLSHNALGPVVAELLARAPFARTLASLDLARNALGDRGARVLDLSCNALGDDGAVALSRASTLSSLTQLRLSANHVGPHGLRMLARSPHVPFSPDALERETLQTNKAPEPAWSREVAELSAGPRGSWAWSHTLDVLESRGVSRRWLEAALPYIRQRSTDPERAAPHAIGRHALIRALDGLPTATAWMCDTLDLRELPRGVDIGAPGATRAEILERVLAVEEFHHVTRIVGRYSHFGDAEAGALARARGPRILALDIDGATISAVGLTALSHAPCLRDLRSLSMRYVNVAPESVVSIARSSQWERVRAADFDGIRSYYHRHLVIERFQHAVDSLTT